jgi:sugar lactone lactonase YvrE
MKISSALFFIASSACILTAIAVGCSSGPGADILGASTTKAVAVTDYENSRVLIYNTPISTDQNAAFVIGQKDFTTTDTGTSATSLYYPWASHFDVSGNLWVTDYDNSRVLEFKAPFSNGMAASVVLGQTNFTSSESGTSASTFGDPSNAVSDSTGHIWVSDYDNSRVLRFSPPFTTGMSADLVLGQSNFTSNNCDTTATSLCYPWQGLAFAPNGYLWVSDYDNCRILGYAPPFSMGMAASIVIGQSSMTTDNCGTSATQFEYAYGLAVDSSGNLWAADEDNSRVLEYKAPLTTGMAASVVLGQSDFTSSNSGVTASLMEYPSAISFDSEGNAYVADSDNNRVLVFSPPFTTGMSASKVLGQANFTSNEENQGKANPAANTLYYPSDVTTLQ